MKKILFFVSSMCTSMLDAFKKVPADKTIHAIVSFMLMIVMFWIAYHSIGFGKTISMMVSGLIVVVVSILKEMCDDITGGSADIDDIIADVVGLSVASVILLILV